MQSRQGTQGLQQIQDRPDVWVKERIREYLDHLLSTETFSPLADPEELWDRTRERARRVR